MNITKAVIPVAGKGTRFLPASKQVPKEMLPLIRKPIILYVVEELVSSGIEEVIFVTSAEKSIIENFFDRNLVLEKFLEENKKYKELELIQNIGNMVDIISVRQKEQLGLGHAVLCAEKIIGKHSFAVALGDEVIHGPNPATKQLKKVSEKNKGSSVIGVMEVKKSDVSKYGIIGGVETSDDKTIKMTSMIEKPSIEEAPSCLATPGRYVFNSNIFECLRNIKKGTGGEYQLTDAINMLKDSENVFAYKFEGTRFDTGNVPAYLDATVEMALLSDEYSSLMQDIIRDKIRKFNI